MNEQMKQICQHCGPGCLGGAAHNARMEDGFMYPELPAAAPEQPAPDADVVEDLAKRISEYCGYRAITIPHRELAQELISVAEPIITAKARDGWVHGSESWVSKTDHKKKVFELEQQLATMEHDERMEEQTIKQRDDAEEALSQAYYLITGRSPEWSNLFGHAEALEEIDDAQQTLRKQLATMHTVDAVEKALHDGWISRCGGYKNLPELLADVVERLTAKPKQERVTVVPVTTRLMEGVFSVCLDGKIERGNLSEKDAERYATGLRAEIAAAEKEDDHARG